MPLTSKQPGAAEEKYLLLLPVFTVVLLSCISGYTIPANRSATLGLAILTTPYGLIQNLVFNAHPEWLAVYQHAATRPGFMQNGFLFLIYCVQVTAVLLCMRRLLRS